MKGREAGGKLHQEEVIRTDHLPSLTCSTKLRNDVCRYS